MYARHRSDAAKTQKTWKAEMSGSSGLFDNGWSWKSVDHGKAVAMNGDAK
jgi:hypothetical protein